MMMRALLPDYCALTTMRRSANSSIAIFKRRPLSEWTERLNQHDVPFAPINNIEVRGRRPTGAAPWSRGAGRGAQ